MSRSSLRVLPVLAAFALAACSEGPNQPLPATDVRLATAREANKADGKYVVVFTDDVSDAPGLARALAKSHGAALRFTYTNAIKGMAVANLSDAQAAALSRNPHVKYIELDAPAELFTTQSNPPSWGLDRVDQDDLPLNQSYNYDFNGTGTNVYIIDTGIRRSHIDFGGRANFAPAGANGSAQGNFYPDGRDGTDCHGHGTHVAGTAAGAQLGVAKGAAIWGMRVLDCQGRGDVSYAIAAVDWCTVSCIRPAVVNMSLGYGDVQSLRDAVGRSVDAGVNYAVAGGNGDFLGRPLNACLQSPAGQLKANTVGSTTSTDNESSFSNYGSCVDILAPGSAIVSASHSSDNGLVSMSGTSMASPHVAGTIAIYLQENPLLTPAEVSALLKSRGQANTITRHTSSVNNGTVNLFLQTLGGGDPPPPPADAPPTATFTKSCSGFTCTFTSTATDDNGITARTWTFSIDGSTATGNSVTKTFSRRTNSTVTHRTTDTANQSTSSSQTVSCNQKKCS
jgi:serine protease